MVNGSPFFLTVFLKGVCGVCAECEKERIALVPLFLIKLDLKILRAKRVNPNCHRILVIEWRLFSCGEGKLKIFLFLFFNSVKLYPSHFFIFPSLISSRYSIRNEVGGGPSSYLRTERFSFSSRTTRWRFMISTLDLNFIFFVFAPISLRSTCILLDYFLLFWKEIGNFFFPRIFILRRNE